MEKILIFLIITSMLLAITVFILLLRNRHLKKEYLANDMIDKETNIGNLQFFKHHFTYAISDNSGMYYIAYIILDISYLRSYNGNSSFEEVLKHTSSVLSQSTGDKEICARITENGFAFVFCSVNDEEAEKRLKELMNKLNNFENSKGKNNKIVFRCSFYYLDSSDSNIELLLFNLRKNCINIVGTEKQIIKCDIHSMNKVLEEKEFSESIINGLKKNEFKLFLQFVVDNRTKNIVSAEALSRWDNSEKGLIGPGKYINIMETTGLISEHDFYMFELVCRQLEEWSNTKFKDISISCNFTRITLSEENFIDKIKNISNNYNFDKSNLCIEITEDAIEKDRETATQNMCKCKELGIRIYLDDLGSGYTSLANLCDYPIDIVKLDRDILLKADTNRGKDLLTGIIALAHSMNISVICEGVETKEQNDWISTSDCDYIQGWYYSKPIPLEECESFVENYNINNK